MQIISAIYEGEVITARFGKIQRIDLHTLTRGLYLAAQLEREPRIEDWFGSSKNAVAFLCVSGHAIGDR
jgi:hypothetical protein